MVGYANKEEEKRREQLENHSFVENNKTSDDPLGFSFPDIYDFSFPLTDSFLDFDPIKEWLEEDPPYVIDDVGEDMSNYFNQMGSKEFCVKPSSAEVCFVNDEAEKIETLGYFEQEKSNEGVKVGSLVDFVQESGDVGDVMKCIEKGNEQVVEKIEFKEGGLGEVGFSIEEELRRVSLNHELSNYDMAGVGGSKVKNEGVVDDEANVAKNGSIDNSVGQSDEILNVDGDRVGKTEVVSDRDESGSEGLEEERKRKPDIAGRGETELEEGEIMASEEDEMVAWSDEEDDEDAAEGPIMSKNEIADLPPVPAVNVTLLPHHRTLSVGIILSILGPQVVVEGVERHNPLNEGSILWITESRSPLGLVDEVFGPVKNPYYIVRYNSETEVPTGLQQGTQISFVTEFADHVLNNPNLYRKGYDASGENDEELSEESEFSDDEKEAEYRRMQKMKKRGTNEDKGRNRKRDKRKSKNRFEVGKVEQSAAKQAHDLANNVSTQHFVQPPGVSLGTMPAFSSGLTPSHPLPHLGVTPGSNATTSSNVWLNKNLSQQTAGTGFPINPQMQNMPWLKGSHPRPVVQAPSLNKLAFQQNVHMNPSLPSNIATVVGRPNFGPGPAFAPWPGCVSLNFLNQSLPGMGMQGQNAPALNNLGTTAVSSSALQHGGVAHNFLNQLILGMGMQGQNASTNASANAIPFNGFGFQPMATSNTGQDAFQNFNPGTLPSNGFQPMVTSNTGQDAFQNFNPGTPRGGGRRPYFRGGGRFGGGRGRRPS